MILHFSFYISFFIILCTFFTVDHEMAMTQLERDFSFQKTFFYHNSFLSFLLKKISINIPIFEMTNCSHIYKSLSQLCRDDMINLYLSPQHSKTKNYNCESERREREREREMISSRADESLSEIISFQPSLV